MKAGIPLLRCTQRLPLLVARQVSRNITTTTTKFLLAPEYNHIRKVFDSQKYFNHFTKQGSHATLFSSPQTGLFHNEYLTTPQGLVDFPSNRLAKQNSWLARCFHKSTLLTGNLNLSRN